MGYTVRFGKVVRTGKTHAGRSISYGVSSTAYDDTPKLAKDKGKFEGSCNVTRCQRPSSATWYNFGSMAYYCERCAFDINRDGCRRFRDPMLVFEVVPEDSHQRDRWTIEWHENIWIKEDYKDELGMIKPFAKRIGMVISTDESDAFHEMLIVEAEIGGRKYMLNTSKMWQDVIDLCTEDDSRAQTQELIARVKGS